MKAQPASVTRRFTAAVLLLLVEKGKVGLDGPVCKYVGKTPESWARIRVRMQLSHTSGLPIDGFPGFEGSPLHLITTKQALEFNADGPGPRPSTRHSEPRPMQPFRDGPRLSVRSRPVSPQCSMPVTSFWLPCPSA